MGFNFRRFLEGINLLKPTSTVSEAGDIDFSSDTDKLNLHNGTSASPIVTEDHTATLTNKTIDGDTNTLINIPGDEINPGSVTNTELADMVDQTIKGNNSGSTGAPQDISTTDVTAMLDVMVGDSGSGGTKGLVPAPAAGDTAANKFLKANGTWSTVGEGDVSGPSSAGDLEVPVFDGTSGKVIKTTGVTIDSSDNISTPGDVSSGGTVTGEDVKATNLTSNRAVVTGTSGILATVNVTDTELGYSGGLTGSIQNQLDNKVGLTQTATLTNKTIDGDDNTLQDIALTSLKTVGGDANKFIQRDGTGAVISGKTVPTGDVVGSSDTQTLTNKTIQGANFQTPVRSDVKQDTKANLVTYASTATNGQLVFATDEKKMYQVVDSALKAVGGGGSGGINFMALSTTWAPDNTDNVDAESSLGQWATFADAAGVLPTDLTGGTATQVAITRATTIPGTVLNGNASFLITKQNANAQGEGVSCTFNVPPAYQGKVCSINIPYKFSAGSGSVVSGDIGVWIYDVTNSQLITPFNNVVLGQQGTLVCTFPTTAPANSIANQQYRIGFYFASTSTSFIELLFDDVYVGPQEVIYGQSTDIDVLRATGGSATGNVTVSGFGSFTNSGKNILSQGTSRLTALRPCTIWLDCFAPGVASQAAQVIFYKNGVSNWSTSIYPSARELNAQYFTTLNTGDYVEFVLSNNGSTYSNFQYNCVAEAVTNTPLTSASTFSIASILANGTRVTGTDPVALGQYRSFQKSASSFAITDTAPGALPSSVNGMAIGAQAYGTAGSGTFNICQYRIFIGKNKNYALQAFASTGRTGLISTDWTDGRGGNTQIGIMESYDPTTGILTLDTTPSSTAYTSNFVGVTPNTGSGPIFVSTCYFDVTVSEPAIPVQVSPLGSFVQFSTPSGFGSSNSTVRNFTVIDEQEGTDVTGTVSASLGTSVRINTDGMYEIYYQQDYNTGAACAYYATVDSTNLSTTPTDGQIKLALNPQANTGETGTRTLRLRAGQIVRPQGNTGTKPNSTVVGTKFIVTKVGN